MTKQDILKYFKDINLAYNNSVMYDNLSNMLDMLEQEPTKKGHWKEIYAETDYRNGWIEFTCEFCEYQHGLESGQYGWYYGEPIPWKYCPCCGAKMESEAT